MLSKTRLARAKNAFLPSLIGAALALVVRWALKIPPQWPTTNLLAQLGILSAIFAFWFVLGWNVAAVRHLRLFWQDLISVFLITVLLTSHHT
jgi:hypothetical protein